MFATQPDQTYALFSAPVSNSRRDDLVTSRLMTANPGSEQLLAATDAAAEAGTDLAAGPLM
ncbi:hypothetical protein [Cupriavidus numazuensis]|uniref:Uncharacterized protein n=2 Tax=Cupriavidus numazuensis TaxID=221992 RepID=A0ABM8TWE3_9BURK|nr:hypothetical protein LMG26411_08004 [Cupriavidus numazuensis]